MRKFSNVVLSIVEVFRGAAIINSSIFGRLPQAAANLCGRYIKIVGRTRNTGASPTRFRSVFFISGVGLVKDAAPGAGEGDRQGSFVLSASRAVSMRGCRFHNVFMGEPAVIRDRQYDQESSPPFLLFTGGAIPWWN
ncbi:hypothetical protein MTP99_018183 [Tenebrio molitor]|nr:hypothetical protein MTP99_018183 [Tenebrio molitor]